MAKAVTEKKPPVNEPGEQIDLARFMSRKVEWKAFDFWIVGDTPLIVHAWSAKAKEEILQKQVRAYKATGRDPRDPQQDYENAFYRISPDEYGFPAMAVKNCIVSAAHKDKGIPQTLVQRALFVKAPFYQIRPALAGATCNMPLFKVYGSDPIMREDMGRIGSGLKKTAALIYRPSFDTWAMRVRGRYNSAVLNDEILAALVEESGYSAGIGEWRNERKGVFGAFHLGTDDEQKAWHAYRLGSGPLPVTEPEMMEAA
jgi:hypothetical protein